MIVSAKAGGNFQPHPETNGLVRGVVVDITPPKEVPDSFNQGQMKTVFKVVIESEEEDENGRRFAVWTKPLTPSLNEKANLTKLLKQMRGRDLTEEEKKGFDLDTLIGQPVQMIIAHETRDGTTYANIGHLQTHKGPDPLLPSGKFVRAQDREKQDGAGAAYSKGAGTESARLDWQTCKVHVGRHKGLPLGDLEQEAVEALIAKWLPEAKAAAKPTADDKRLIAALGEVQAMLAGASAAPAEEASPY